MTNRDIIGRVKATLKEHSADSVISNRHVYNVLLTKAKVLLKREADDKMSLFKTSNIWKRVCVEMEPVSSLLCKCLCIPYECTIYRSKHKLSFIESAFGAITRNISTPDNSTSFTLTTPFSYNIKSKIKGNKVKYVFIEDGHLYTPDYEYPYLTVEGIFEVEPKDCSETDNCLSKLDQNFILPDHLEDACVQMALQEFGITVQLTYDRIPNKNETQKTAN